VVPAPTTSILDVEAQEGTLAGGSASSISKFNEMGTLVVGLGVAGLVMGL